MSLDKACMVDIETLNVTPDAVILSLGACSILGKETFYLEFNKYQGRSTSKSTLEWWLAQGVPMPNGSVDLEEGLQRFSEWYTAQGFTEIWCKGTDFDFVILKNAYESFQLETPWKYNEVRDLRTLQKLYTGTVPCEYKVHNALTDAICQSINLRFLCTNLLRAISTDIHVAPKETSRS